MNRRLYKQGKVLKINSVQAFNTTGRTVLKICTVPNTWMSRQAWKRGKRIHDAQFNRAIEASGGVMQLPSYHDYKVYMNASMVTDPDFLSNTISDHNGNLAEQGEWVYADYETDLAGAGSFKVGFLGEPADTNGDGSTDYVGLIQSYGEARRTVPEELGRDTDAENEELNAVLAFANSEAVQDEIYENVMNDNDTPPYAGSGENALVGNKYVGAGMNMPSSQLVRLMAVGGSGGSNTNANPDVETSRGFDAICGLVEIETLSSASDDTIDVVFEIAVGDYKGVAAHDI